MELTKAHKETVAILKKAIDNIALLSEDNAIAIGRAVTQMFASPQVKHIFNSLEFHFPPNGLLKPKKRGPKGKRRRRLAEIINNPELSDFIFEKIVSEHLIRTHIAIALNELKIIDWQEVDKAEVAEALGVEPSNFRKIINRYQKPVANNPYNTVRHSVNAIILKITNFLK